MYRLFGLSEPLKNTLDWIAGLISVATLMNLLPAVASLLSAIWAITRVYEAFTGDPFHETRAAKFVSGKKRKKEDVNTD